MPDVESVRLLAEHFGPWGAATGFIVLVARSRPARALTRVVADEIRWRYLRRKGVPEVELRRRLLDGWDDDRIE